MYRVRFNIILLLSSFDLHRVSKVEKLRQPPLIPSRFFPITLSLTLFKSQFNEK